MGWNKITIDTLTSAEDMISYELTELGATGVEVEDHVSLTEEEMKARMRELSYLKIPPREQEKNKVLLLRGERLYEETTGELREQLEMVTQQFERILDRQDPLKIEEARKDYEEALDWIEEEMWI